MLAFNTIPLSCTFLDRDKDGLVPVMAAWSVAQHKRSSLEHEDLPLSPKRRRLMLATASFNTSDHGECRPTDMEVVMANGYTIGKTDEELQGQSSQSRGFPLCLRQWQVTLTWFRASV